VVDGPTRGSQADRTREETRQIDPDRLAAMVACLSSLGPDPSANIQRLTQACGELLGADSAAYGHVEDDRLWVWNRRGPCEGHQSAVSVQGHVRLEVLRGRADDVVRIDRAQSDGDAAVLGVRHQGDCAGMPVQVAGRAVGTLCAAYELGRQVSAGDDQILRAVARAIGAEDARLSSSEALRRRERYLECVAEASADLLHTDDYVSSLPQVLERLRNAADAQRCYFVHIVPGPDGSPQGLCRFEARLEGIGTLPPVAGAYGVDSPLAILSRWSDALSSGSAVWGRADQFPPAERDLLRAQGIEWIVALPVHARGQWHGVIALDSAQAGRPSTASEVALLGGAADALSAAVERTDGEAQRRALTELAFELSGSEDVEAIGRIIRQVTFRLLGWDAHYFAVRRPEEEEFSTQAFIDTVDGRQLGFPGRRWLLDLSAHHDRQLSSGRPVLVEHDPEDIEAGTERFGDTERPSRCLLFCPVRNGLRVTGIISVQSYTARRYGAADLDLVQRIADAVAPALERAFALEAVSSRARDADVLHSLAVALSDAEDEGEMVAHTLAAIVELADAEGGAIYLLDPEVGGHRLRHSVGVLRSLTQQLPVLTADDPRVRASVASRAVVSLAELAQSDGKAGDWLRLLSLAGAYLLPLPSPEGPTGIVVAATTREGHALAPGARSALTSAAAELGAALRRRRAEEALRRSERRFRETCDLLPDMVYEADAALRMTYANRAAMETLGHTLEDIETGLTLMDLLRPEDHERCRQFVRGVERQFMAAVAMFDIRAKDGAAIPCEISVAAIRGADGQLTGFRGVARDVTERVRAQSVDRLAAVGRLAAGVAYEFDSITTAARACAQRARQAQDLAELQELTSAIVAGADRGSAMCRNLTGFVRPEDGRREPIPICQPVDGALAIAQPQLDAAGVTLHRTDETRGALVNADAAQLQQVFLSLFLNACSAMPEGGHLSIEAALGTGPADGLEVVVRVSHNGLQFGPEDLSRIFAPVPPSVVTDGPAQEAGLGLWIPRDIVAAHSGSLTAQNQQGTGAVFEVRLTASHPAPPGELHGAPQPVWLPDTMLGGTVLLAEDDRPLRRGLTIALRHAGCEVLEAGSTEEAIGTLRERTLDLVISDLMMPGGGGRAVLLAAREAPVPPPVIIITGMDQQALAPDLLEIGAAECLQKPFELQQLMDLVYRIRLQ